ncbi:hypothetical protein P4H61_02980 [Paenibacillus peoriae]|uniref:hypothetical protein n=1 Tax=Paenibacillus peoriae TaxID=59893 RepID=UPI00026C680F|nr:hypothetical protein [Paenibacillus peoriae]MEC0180458.1 hypothetical protein [Paenibacillus peoriae]
MLSRYIVGGRLDPPFYPTKTKPCIASRRIDIDGLRVLESKRMVTDIFKVSNDLEFFAISIKADKITPADYWSLVVDENIIVNHVYCKDYSEGLYFQVAHPVKGGREFRFEFYTESAARKRIETSYYFLTDPEVVLRLHGITDQSYDLFSI